MIGALVRPEQDSAKGIVPQRGGAAHDAMKGKAFETGEAAYCSIREANPCQPSTRRRKDDREKGAGGSPKPSLLQDRRHFVTLARRNSETDEVLRGAKQHRSGCLLGR